MTLKSALQDVKETTLSAVSGLLGKLSYLASLHGAESSERALKAAHSEIVTGILRMPLASLTEDLEKSSRDSGMAAQPYVEEMRGHFEDLLPEGRQNSPSSSHLSSVLQALSSLEKNRERATRSTS